MGSIASITICPASSSSERQLNTVGKSVHDKEPKTASLAQTSSVAAMTTKQKTHRMIHSLDEEYQTLEDESKEILLFRVAPHLEEHPMIHDKYCFVLDTESEHDHLGAIGPTCTNSNGQNRPQKSRLGLALIGYSQPTCKSLVGLVDAFVNSQLIPRGLILNIRSDPCLFSLIENDWYPYTLRDYQSIEMPLTDDRLTGEHLDSIEVQARDEVIHIVNSIQQESFYFYDDITFFENQPKENLANQTDYLLTSEEVYSGAALCLPGMSYLRLNFPINRFPREEEIDRYVREIRAMCGELLGSSKQLVSSGQSNVDTSASTGGSTTAELPGFFITGHRLDDGAVQLAMAITHLTLRAISNSYCSSCRDQQQNHAQRFDAKRLAVPSITEPGQQQKSGDGGGRTTSAISAGSTNPLHDKLRKGMFYFIRQLGRYLPFMVQIKEEVDLAIDDVGDKVNIREQIMDKILDFVSYRHTEEARDQEKYHSFYDQIINCMERYYMLICFNAFLHEQMTLRFSLDYSAWMRNQPKLYQLLYYLDVSEWHETVEALKFGTRVMVTDKSLVFDDLATLRSTKLANFRQLVGWPIYGASQPDSAAVKHVLTLIGQAYWHVALAGLMKPSRRESTGVGGKDSATANNSVPVLVPKLVWVNLRNEYVVDCATRLTATWRNQSSPRKPIAFDGISGSELVELEEKFAVSLTKLSPPAKLFNVEIEGDKLTPEVLNTSPRTSTSGGRSSTSVAGSADNAAVSGPLFKSLATSSSVIRFESQKKMFQTAFSSVIPNASAASDSDNEQPSIPISYLTQISKQAEYHRMPLPKYGPPPPSLFDQILRLVVQNARGLFTSTVTALSLVDTSSGCIGTAGDLGRSSCGGASLPTGPDARVDCLPSTSFVFFCVDGRERTSLAMSIAGLAYCHLFGFSFGYRLDEEERISLRDAKYTKGEFQVIHRLTRKLPNGKQLKREVDYVLDKCFESMSMMHFHVREAIFRKYNQSRDEPDPACKEMFRRQSLAYLEKYFFLILFNSYLHDGSPTRWKTTFDIWLQKTAKRCDFMSILDNFGFPEFEQLDQFQYIRNRWKPSFMDFTSSSQHQR